MNQDLKELVYGGTKNIVRDGGEVIEAETESLLTQLQTAKTIRKGEGGGNKTSAPVGLDPVVIEQEIISDIREHLPNEYAHINKLPLVERVLAWWKHTKAPDKADIVFAWCEMIRAMEYEYFTLSSPCPVCGRTRVRRDEGDQVVWLDALVVCVQTQVASCRNSLCGQVWAGFAELSKLGELVRG